MARRIEDRRARPCSRLCSALSPLICHINQLEHEKDVRSNTLDDQTLQVHHWKALVDLRKKELEKYIGTLSDTLKLYDPRIGAADVLLQALKP